MNRFIVFLILVYGFFSCSSKENSLLESFLLTQEIYPQKIAYPDLLGITMQMMKHDSLLFINDFRGDTLISVLDIKNQVLKKKLVPVGNGPGEYHQPYKLHINKEKNRVTVADRHLNKLLTYDLTVVESFHETNLSSYLIGYTPRTIPNNLNWGPL